jgi:hypothetical protein
MTTGTIYGVDEKRCEDGPALPLAHKHKESQPVLGPDAA